MSCSLCCLCKEGHFVLRGLGVKGRVQSLSSSSGSSSSSVVFFSGVEWSGVE